MCIMCIEVAKDRMTVKEARNALPELVRSAQDENEIEHYKELQEADDEKLQQLAKEAAEKIDRK